MEQFALFTVWSLVVCENLLYSAGEKRYNLFVGHILSYLKNAFQYTLGTSQVALVVKNLPANATDIRDRSVLGSGRSPGGGHGNPLQYSCLENPMDRGAWWSRVHGVIKSWTHLKQLSVYTYIRWRHILFDFTYTRYLE